MDKIHTDKKLMRRVGCELPSDEARRVFFAAQGNRGQPMPIYRGLISESTMIYRGDWVTISRRRALYFAEMDEGHVVTATVLASALFQEGLGCREWGYDGDADLYATPISLAEMRVAVAAEDAACVVGGCLSLERVRNC